MASQRLPRARPASAVSITGSSKIFTPIITERLLKRSAKYPPVMENRMKGMAKSSPTTETSLSRWAIGMAIPSTQNWIRNLSALSLKAPWNWVTIRLQNPPRHRTPVSPMDGFIAQIRSETRLPDLSQLQHEAGQLRISGDALRAVENLGLLGGPVDMDLECAGIDQPTELRSIFAFLDHFTLQGLEYCLNGPQLGWLIDPST